VLVIFVAQAFSFANQEANQRIMDGIIAGLKNVPFGLSANFEKSLLL